MFSLGPAQFECGCAKGSVMVKQNPPTCTQKLELFIFTSRAI